MTHLHDQLNTIQSRDDFVSFVRALSKDFQDNPEEWENITVDSYLDALAAWTNDMDGLYDNTGEKPPVNVDWKFIAQLLLAAKIYE